MKNIALLLLIILSQACIAEELFVGKVVFAQQRNTVNELNQPEVTIEWLSQRVTPIQPMTMEQIRNSKEPIPAKLMQEYFVTTIRSQELKPELITELVTEINNKPHVAVQYGPVNFSSTINNQQAKYLSGQGGIYDNIKLKLQ